MSPFYVIALAANTRMEVAAAAEAADQDRTPERSVLRCFALAELDNKAADQICLDLMALPACHLTQERATA